MWFLLGIRPPLTPHVVQLLVRKNSVLLLLHVGSVALAQIMLRQVIVNWVNYQTPMLLYHGQLCVPWSLVYPVFFGVPAITG